MDAGWNLGLDEPGRQHEHALLSKILEAPEARAPRLVLADFLDDRGDDVRAAILQWTVAALDGVSPSELAALLSKLPPEHRGWASLVGSNLVCAALSDGALTHIPHWLSVARPAIDVTIEGHDDTQALGATRFFGDPDLPSNHPWPSYGDCSRWFEMGTTPVDPELPCRFVAQFAARDLRHSPAAAGLPATGLLSIFAFVEVEEWGITEVCVQWFPDVRHLERRPHPTDVAESVDRLPPHRVGLSHTLSLPEDDGPWTGWCGEAYPPVLAARSGLFGYIQTTSGPIDDLPARDWQRLSCLPTDLEGVVWNHVAMPSAHLATGRFDSVLAVWADMDG